MKSIVARGSLSLFLSLAAGLGCSSSATPVGGAVGGGGATGSGGKLGSGGAPGSGGSAETGGSVATGGKGSGGLASSGGTSGLGGALQGSGGVGATAGTQATGGNTDGGATATGGTSASGGTSGAAISIFDGKTLTGWSVAHNGKADAFSVNVADGAIASTGGVRASLYYSQNKYSFYRVIYSVRQVKRTDHDPGVLFFGTEPTQDALWGVMFALPHHWGWDYRGGVSNGLGTPAPNAPNLDLTQWARCELLVNSATGTAKAACAQPITAKAVPLISFTDANNPKVPGYFGILCHSAGEVDEYKDITLEANPAVNDLITTK